jgi:hypothetical protein
VTEKPKKKSCWPVNNNNNNNHNNSLIVETLDLHRGDMVMHLDPPHDDSSPRVLISDEVVAETWIWRDVDEDGASLLTIVPTGDRKAEE